MFFDNSITINYNLTKGHELSNLIRHYLEHEDERMELVKQIKSIIIEKHTYAARAKSLSNYLKTVNLELKPKKINKAQLDIKNNNSNRQTSSLCIGIRTIEVQLLYLEVLIQSLLIQYEKSKYKNQILLKIYII